MQRPLGRACAANLGEVEQHRPYAMRKSAGAKVFQFCPKTSQFFSPSSCVGIDDLFLYHFEDYGKEFTCGPVGLESCEGLVWCAAL